SGSATLNSSLTCAEACGAGYTSLTYPTQSCFAGVWTAPQPACKQQCSQPTPPTGAGAGTCIGPIDGNGGTCTLAILSGYTLASGSLTITCNDGVRSALPTFSANPCTGSALASLLAFPARRSSDLSGSATLNSSLTCAEACGAGYTSLTYPTQSC